MPSEEPNRKSWLSLRQHTASRRVRKYRNVERAMLPVVTDRICKVSGSSTRITPPGEGIATLDGPTHKLLTSLVVLLGSLIRVACLDGMSITCRVSSLSAGSVPITNSVCLSLDIAMAIGNSETSTESATREPGKKRSAKPAFPI